MEQELREARLAELDRLGWEWDRGSGPDHDLARSGQGRLSLVLDRMLSLQLTLSKEEEEGMSEEQEAIPPPADAGIVEQIRAIADEYRLYASTIYQQRSELFRQAADHIERDGRLIDQTLGELSEALGETIELTSAQARAERERDEAIATRNKLHDQLVDCEFERDAANKRASEAEASLLAHKLFIASDSARLVGFAIGITTDESLSAALREEVAAYDAARTALAAETERRG